MTISIEVYLNNALNAIALDKYKRFLCSAAADLEHGFT